MKKIKLLFTIAAAIAPATTVLSCTSNFGEPEGTNRVPGDTNRVPGDTNNLERKRILASFSSYYDIASSLGFEPRGVANKGMENAEVLPYLKHISGANQENYKDMQATYKDIEGKLMAKKYDTIIGYLNTKNKPAEDQGYFDNLIDVSASKFPKHFSDEKISWQLPNKTKDSNEFAIHNFYERWDYVATELSSIYDINVVKRNEKIKKQTKKRIEFLRNKIKKINNRKLAIYSYGSKSTPSESIQHNFDENSGTGGALKTNKFINYISLFYSKKHGLGFDTPTFNADSNLSFNESGNTIINNDNGEAGVRQALRGQNDYFLLSCLDYEKTLSNNQANSHFGDMVKSSVDANEDGLRDNIFWTQNFSISNAASGPKGLNYILDWVSNLMNIKGLPPIEFG